MILLIVLAYWFCSYHDYPAHFDMYVHIVVYLVCLSVDSLVCILSWSSLSMLSLLYSSWLSCSCLACVWTWVIYLRFAWLLVVGLLFSYVIACCLSVWDTHLPPYLQLPSLSRSCLPWSHIWYETCYFVCSSTKLVIRSRV